LVWAVVVFTGSESKLIRNSSATPSKRSSVDRGVDTGILIVFVALAALCSLSALLFYSRQEHNAFYLPYMRSSGASDAAESWVTFLILYNNLVPISLYVSLEVVKVVQARLIQWDRGMFWTPENEEEGNTNAAEGAMWAGEGAPISPLPDGTSSNISSSRRNPTNNKAGASTGGHALARTSNLNESLGSVEYIFSDKTGTLTQNKMEFSQCSVAGIAYGSLADDAPRDVNASATTAGVQSSPAFGSVPSPQMHSGSFVGGGGGLAPTTPLLPSFTSKIASRRRASIIASQQRFQQHQQLQHQRGGAGHHHPGQSSLSTVSPSAGSISAAAGSVGTPLLSPFSAAAVAAAASSEAAASSGESGATVTATAPHPSSTPASAAVAGASSSLLPASPVSYPPSSSLPQFGSDPSCFSPPFPAPAPVAGYSFDDGPFRLVLDDPSHPSHARAREFVLCMALCHAVMPQRAKQPGGGGGGYKTLYHSASPDDTALVISARELGCELYDRGANFVKIRVRRPLKIIEAEIAAKRAAALHASKSPADAQPAASSGAVSPASFASIGTATAAAAAAAVEADDAALVASVPRFEEHVFDVLAENAFTSDRRCMSVLVRTPAGELVNFVKGADEVILPRLRADLRDSDEETLTRAHLADFASEGLRTLVLAKVVLDEREAEAWLTRFQDTKLAVGMSTKDKERALAHLAAEVERNLLLVGASAIEDRLQEQVPETITKLVQAGVAVWMLTGDKLETGLSIGYSCRLLHPQSQLVKLTSGTVEQCTHALAAAIKKYEAYLGRRHPTLAIIVSGKALALIFPSDVLRTLFLQLCRMAKTLIACRCLPSQKSAIVDLVRFGLRPEPMTLAIGDGANDCDMIQHAAIGVGISGNEGMQAVRASDYALCQFSHLQRLLFVHGRYNYTRVTSLIFYCFYKNACFVLTLFYFGFYTGFSGTTLYDSWLGTMWNVLFTVLPVLLLGVLEQDVSAEAALANPLVYFSGLPGNGGVMGGFGLRRAFLWLATAFLHSLLVFFLVVAAMGDADATGGGEEGVALSILGSTVNFVTVATVTLKIALTTRYFAAPVLAGLLFSLLAWFAFVLAYSRMLAISWDYFGVAPHLLSTAPFWLLALLAPVAANIVDFAGEHLLRWYFPSPVDIVAERSREARALGLPLDFQAEYEAALRGGTGSNNSSALQSRTSTTSSLLPKSNHSLRHKRHRSATTTTLVSSSRATTTLASSKQRLSQTERKSTESLDLAGATTADAPGGVVGAGSRKPTERGRSGLGSIRQQQPSEELQQDDEEMELQKARMKADVVRAAVQARESAELREQAQGIGAAVMGTRGLEERKEYLRRILAGDVSAMRSKLYSHVDPAGSLSVLDRIAMQPFTLAFVNQPELEREFRNKYVLKSLRLTRTSMSVLFLLMVLYAALTAASQADQWRARLVLTGLAGVALVVLVWPRWFRRYFSELLCVILLAVSVAKTVLVTENGSVGMLVFAIACFLLLRLRFVNACMIVLWDVVSFSIYVSVTHSTSLSGWELLRVDYIHLCVCVFCAYACYLHEVAFRRDFLWQKVYQQEKARTQVILDNVLPPHISKQMHEMKVARERAALEAMGIQPGSANHPQRGGIRRLGSFVAGMASIEGPGGAMMMQSQPQAQQSQQQLPPQPRGPAVAPVPAPPTVISTELAALGTENNHVNHTNNNVVSSLKDRKDKPSVPSVAGQLLRAISTRTAADNVGRSGQVKIAGAGAPSPLVQPFSFRLSPGAPPTSTPSINGAGLAGPSGGGASRSLFDLDEGPLDLSAREPTSALPSQAASATRTSLLQAHGRRHRGSSADYAASSDEMKLLTVSPAPRSLLLQPGISPNRATAGSAAGTGVEAVGVSGDSNSDDEDGSGEEDAFDESVSGIYAPRSRNAAYLRGIPSWVFQSNYDVIAHVESEVSILFCDLMGFSGFLSKRTPAEVVAILDGVYSTFDELAVMHGVTKMETVGKTYMAAAGLRGTRKDHAHACAELAFQMIAIMKTFTDNGVPPASAGQQQQQQQQQQRPGHTPKARSSAGLSGGSAIPQPGNEVILPRIGIHTGVAISGVVGVKRPQFSLFGDSVNTASRLQSTGAIDRVHVSAATHAYLARDYTCIARTVEVKGKGSMHTFYIEEKLSHQAGSSGGRASSTNSQSSASTASSPGGAGVSHTGSSGGSAGAVSSPLAVPRIPPVMQRKRSFRLLTEETSVQEVLELIKQADSAHDQEVR
jgi:magnesium-transporting ATPase (P-type)/class 3 adenylate cyclase